MKVLPHYIASSFPSTYASSPPEAKPVCSYFYQFTPNFQIVFLQQNTSISLGFVMHVKLFPWNTITFRDSVALSLLSFTVR